MVALELYFDGHHTIPRQPRPSQPQVQGLLYLGWNLYRLCRVSIPPMTNSAMTDSQLRLLHGMGDQGTYPGASG